MKKELYLIDGLNIIFRSYYVLQSRPLINTKGENIGALIGFFKTIFSIIKEKNPNYLVIVFDSKTPTLRKQKFKEYKANRPAPPEDLIYQIDIIKKGLREAKIPYIERDGYEADDLIASITKRAKSENFISYIISPDKDMIQLLDKEIKIIKLENQDYIEVDENFVNKKFNIKSSQMIDYLAILGDKSDNVPGVKGIGEKGAQDLLKNFESLEEIYKNLNKVNKKYKKSLEESRENANLSYELIKLHDDLDFGSIEDFKINGYSKNLISFLEEHSANGLIKTFKNNILKEESSMQASLLNPKRQEKLKEKNMQYKTITEKKDLDELMEALERAEFISIDTETDSLDTYSAKLIGISLSFKENEGFYIPLICRGKSFVENSYIREKFNYLFSLSPKLIGQNYKFDYKVLKNNGFNVIKPFFDTMIAHYLIESTLSHSLDFMAERFLNHKTIKFEELVGKNETFADVELEKASEYAAEDADITFKLFNLLKGKLAEDELEYLMYNVEMPLNELLTEMEEEGIYLDIEQIRCFERDLNKKILEREDEIFKSLGFTFNLNSPKQVHEVLFEKLKLKLNIKNNKGSSDIKILENLRESHPIIEKIIEHRQLSKLKSTYTENLVSLVNKKTKRLHTNFIQTRTATGRLSSTNPNLQNIPIKDERGREIRRAFKPKEGCIFLSADYSQIELVVLAHLAKDEELKRAFSKGKDIHRETAATLFKLNESNVSENQRRIAKSINFGIIYRMSDFRLAKELGISREEAKNFIDTYFKTYKNIESFIKETINFVSEYGFVKTILGRRRYIPQINSSNYLERAGAERIAINTAIQGSAADIMKLAMLKTNENLKKEVLKSKILLQVHDELLLETLIEEEKRVREILKNSMENAYKLDLDLKVNIESGNTWGDIH